MVTQSSILTEDPKLPRYRKIPRRYYDGESPHQYLTPKDKYRHMYFETLKLAFGEIQRFQQSDLSIVKEIEFLLVNAANNDAISEVVLDYLGNDVDHNRF